MKSERFDQKKRIFKDDTKLYTQKGSELFGGLFWLSVYYFTVEGFGMMTCQSLSDSVRSI